MRAADERSSINAKRHSSLAWPDSSQGKQLSPPREAAPRGQTRLRRVWKTALDAGTAVSEAGFGEKSLASGRHGRWAAPALSARRRGAASGSREMEAEGPGSTAAGGTSWPLLCAPCRRALSLHFARHPLQTPFLWRFSASSLCISAPCRPGTRMNGEHSATRNALQDASPCPALGGPHTSRGSRALSQSCPPGSARARQRRVWEPRRLDGPPPAPPSLGAGASD